MTPRSRASVTIAAVLTLALSACSGAGSAATVRATTPAKAPATSSPTTSVGQPTLAASAPAVTITPSSAAPSPSSTPSSTASTAASPVSSAYVAPALVWTPCDDGFQCSVLTVPVDYANPSGAKFRLSVLKLPAAQPSERIGSLFVNPGGPGASAVDFLASDVEGFTQNLRNHFDLVTFDPRGVAASDGVHCATNRQLDSYLDDDPDPATPALRATYDKATKAFVQGCSAMSGSVLAHIGTADVARDIETFRVALGEKTLSYFGYSYGTYLGTVLLAQDAAHVRVAVLDGAVDPGQDLVGFVSGQGLAFEAELQRWFAWCTADASCAFRSDPTYRGPGAAPSVTARFASLDAASGTAPVVSNGRPLDSAEFLTGVSYAMYSRSLWPQLGIALASLANGSATQVLALADAYNSRSASGSYDDSLDANTAVNCLDHTGPASTQGYYAAAQQVRKTAPFLGPGIVYQQSSCVYWPVKASPPNTTVAAGAPPTVVVGGIHDPATPYVWAQNLTKDIPGAVLVTHNGDGHTAYGPDNPCIQKIVDAALIGATRPAAGQTCTS